MGRISAGGETYSEMPNSPQGLNRHPKALTQGLGSQILAGVVPFNLQATVFSIGLDLSNQILKVICVCASLSSECKRAEM